MSEIQISASEFMTTREATIALPVGENGEEIQHTFTVRKGAGTELDISMLSSRLVKESQELVNVRNKLLKATDENQATLLGEIGTKMEKVEEIQNQIRERYAMMFNDHEGGEKTKILMDLIGVEGAAKLVRRIFS